MCPSHQPSDITARVTADFAIVKTTQGTGYVNPKANEQLANAQKTGKEIGVYHYAGGGITVTVRRGDTISAIAVRTGCTPPTRWKVPSGNINRIYPGQRVTCGGSGNGGSTRPAGRTVTVRRGDTLSGIASRFDIRVSQLHGYRSGNPSLIYPGEVLRY